MTNDETEEPALHFLPFLRFGFRVSNFGFVGPTDATRRIAALSPRAARRPEAQKETFRRGREGFFVVPRPKLEPRPKFGICKTWR
jgi:hypothetical protein